MPDIYSRTDDPLVLVEWARELGKEYPFFDFHVHPYDVFTGDINYQGDDKTKGLFKKSSSAYQPPSIILQTQSSKRHTPVLSETKLSQAYLLASRLAYLYTGQRVFTDQLDLIGFAGAVLLPVVREPGAAERMLTASENMFGKDNRLFLGCPLPIGIPPNDLLKFFQQASKRWNIAAIKIHPNLMNIDLLTKIGRDLVEATLEAAGTLGVPVIVHGGRTPGIESAEQSEYGTMDRLKEINWGLSNSPVVIAHCGSYGLTEADVQASLSILNRLFDKYPNLMADTSNLETPISRSILLKVDRNRLLFGSDSLYIPIWKAWLQFLQAVFQVSHNPENDLIRMASLNALDCLKLTTKDILQQVR